MLSGAKVQRQLVLRLLLLQWRLLACELPLRMELLKSGA